MSKLRRRSSKRDHMTECCIDDDCDLAHLDQRLLTRVKAEKRCVLIIQGQYRMGTAVLTICGLWHQSRKGGICDIVRQLSPLSSVGLLHTSTIGDNFQL